MREIMILPQIFLAFVFLVAPLVIMIWAYKDAEERGQSGCLIALLIFFTSWVGLIVWLIIRNNLPAPGQPQPEASGPRPAPPYQGQSTPRQSPGLAFFQDLNRIYLNWKAGQISDTEFRISKDDLIDDLERRQVRQDPDQFLAELIPFIEYGVLTPDDITRIRSIVKP